MKVKIFFKYVIPTILAMWVFSIYTLVDGLFVSHFVGPEAFAAVNLSMPVNNTLFSFGILISVGTSTRIGICLGQGKIDKANEIFSSAIFISGILALLTSLLLLIFIHPLANFLGARGPMHQMVVCYLSWVLPFTFFFILSYIFEVLVKVDGVPILSTIGVLSSAITNIFLDYLFIRHFGWGIQGAAFATGLAQLLSFLIFLSHFLKKKGRLKILRIKPKLASLTSAARIGFGDFLTELSYGAILFFFNRSLLSIYGEVGLISYTVINYLSLLLTMTMSGITQGCQPLFSVFYGKEDPRSIRKIFRLALLSVLVASLLFFIPAQLIPDRLISLFISPKNTEAFALTHYALRLYSTAYLFLGYNIFVGGMMAALNQPRFGILISFSRGFLFILLSLTLFKSLAPSKIWLAATTSEVFTLLLTLFSLWKVNKLSQEAFKERI